MIDLTGDVSSDSDVEIMDGPYHPAAGFSKHTTSSRATNPASRPDAGRSNCTKRPKLTTDVAAGAGTSSRQAVEWSCPQCTLVNEAPAMRCVACDFVRPQEALITANEWTCPRCTLSNRTELSRCAACDAPHSTRSKSTQVQSPTGTDEWTCTTCGEAGMPNDFWSCRFCGSIKTGS